MSSLRAAVARRLFVSAVERLDVAVSLDGRSIGRGERRKESAVERTAHAEDLVLRRRSDGARPAASELERTFVCLDTGVAEEHPVGEGEFDESLRQLFAWRCPEQVRDMHQPVGCLVQRLPQALVSVA